jgi:hypothetical protein
MCGRQRQRQLQHNIPPFATLFKTNPSLFVFLFKPIKKIHFILTNEIISIVIILNRACEAS